MSIHARWLWLLGLAVGLFLPTAGVAGIRGVRDGGGVFSKADVVANINRQIEELHERYGLDLCIEMFAEVPADRAAELKQLKADKFFPMWAEGRALAAGADGLYILICSGPRHVEVYAGTDAQATFDEPTRKALRKTLVHKLNRKGADALQEAVDEVRTQLVKKEEKARRGGWLWIVWVMLAIIGGWLIVTLIRRFQGERAVLPPTAISSSALAGQSIYQSVVHNIPDPAPAGAETLPYPPPSPPEPQPEGTVHG